MRKGFSVASHGTPWLCLHWACSSHGCLKWYQKACLRVTPQEEEMSAEAEMNGWISS